MNESRATHSFLSKLKEHGWFYKSSDRFQAGIPDIIGCYEGRFVGIEMKVDTNRPTTLQLYNLEQIKKNGGIGFVVRYRNKSKMWEINHKEYNLESAIDYILGKPYEVQDALF